MNYRSEIAALKRLTKEIDQGEAALETSKWERAKRVAALVDEGYSRKELAGDLGVSDKSVGTWVSIWEAFGSANARSRPRYADADYEIAGRGPGFAQSPQRHDDKVRMARTLLADEKIARDALGGLGHGTKVSLGRSLVRDADVVDDLMRDDRTRREASKAVDRVAQETVRESEARDRQRYPQDTADRDVLSVISFINDANERVKAALRVLREGSTVPKRDREAILEAVDRLEASTEWMRTVAESPHATTDEALEALLERG